MRIKIYLNNLLYWCGILAATFFKLKLLHEAFILSILPLAVGITYYAYYIDKLTKIKIFKVSLIIKFTAFIILTISHISSIHGKIICIIFLLDQVVLIVSLIKANRRVEFSNIIQDNISEDNKTKKRILEYNFLNLIALFLLSSLFPPFIFLVTKLIVYFLIIFLIKREQVKFDKKEFLFHLLGEVLMIIFSLWNRTIFVCIVFSVISTRDITQKDQP